ncbi:MAG: NAD(+) diphosphatase [Polyangiaceae bacterium]
MMAFPRFVSAHKSEPASGDALWTPFRKDSVLVKNDGARPRLLRTEELRALDLPIVRAMHLGSLDELACVTAELSHEAPEVEGHSYLGLRHAFFQLDPEEFHVAQFGFQIQYWDRSYRFCPGCGGPVVLKEKERAKRCEACERDFYPPVVPAMIVRVTRGDSILMTRQSRFPKGMYGLVAGFTEPGESLEACVAREVMEETGLSIANIRYFGSQPWPFPHQIMIGFTAEHASGDIVVDTNELEEARWFDRDAMPMLPPSFSIARALIDDWLAPK